MAIDAPLMATPKSQIIPISQRHTEIIMSTQCSESENDIDFDPGPMCDFEIAHLPGQLLGEIESPGKAQMPLEVGKMLLARGVNSLVAYLQELNPTAPVSAPAVQNDSYFEVRVSSDGVEQAIFRLDNVREMPVEYVKQLLAHSELLAHKLNSIVGGPSATIH
jgi:hypothetical protein